MNISRIVRNPVVLLLMVSLMVTLAVAPGQAYEDYANDFSVKAPAKWAILPASVVPGTFRFGWMAANAMTDKSGASIAVFVKDVGDESAKDLLEKNIGVINGTAEVKADKRAQLKVVKQELITVDGKPGFILEVVGAGTGFAIGVPRDLKANSSTMNVNINGSKMSLSIVPTRQRWFCVIRAKKMIGLLSTCADASYAKYGPVFKSTEATLRVR